VVRLEYRHYREGSSEFPVLYYYHGIGRDEVALRFACDYFVKGSKVYEKTSCAVEPGCYIVYVKEAEDERVMFWPVPAGLPHGVHAELREYRDGVADYRLVEKYSFKDTLEMMLHLQANYLYAEGREWSRTATEIDEDRKTYVIYAEPV
jgi:hypothetical protein